MFYLRIVDRLGTDRVDQMTVLLVEHRPVLLMGMID